MRTFSTLIFVSALAGCSGGAGVPDATPCGFELEWGYRQGGAFIPFGDGDDAEITLGFQGFRYVISTLRLSNVDGALVQLLAQVAVAGEEPFSQRSTFDMPAADPGGDRYIDDVLVFFNDIPIPQLVGKTATVSVRVDASGCIGTHAADLTLTDDDNCIEQPDGGLVCAPDAGP